MGASPSHCCGDMSCTQATWSTAINRTRTSSDQGRTDSKESLERMPAAGRLKA
jgi:hypothetical protein